MTKAFCQLGHEAKLVVHPAAAEPHPDPTHEPLLWATPDEVRHPLWWQKHQPEIVILGLWTRPKYDRVRRAALASTSRLMERADSDGMRTASCGLFAYAKRRFDYFRDRSYRWPLPFSVTAAGIYSFASILATPWIESRLARTLDLLPAVAVETPEATILWKALARRMGVDPQKIHHIPHPIQTDLFHFNPAIPKRNQIISVGRWDSYQKNLPLLLKTLGSFLDKNRTWTSLVIGSGLPGKSPHPRITCLPPLPSPQLAPLMQESRIFLLSSRYESFGLAAAEAVACGNVIVAPNGVWTHSTPSAPKDDPASLLDRLSMASRTPPAHGASSRKNEFSPQNVAQSFLSSMAGLPLAPTRAS